MKIMMIIFLATASIPAVARQVHGFTRREWNQWMVEEDAGGPWDNVRWAWWVVTNYDTHYTVAEWRQFFDEVAFTPDQWTTIWLDDNTWK